MHFCAAKLGERPGRGFISPDVVDRKGEFCQPGVHTFKDTNTDESHFGGTGSYRVIGLGQFNLGLTREDSDNVLTVSALGNCRGKLFAIYRQLISGRVGNGQP